MSRWGVRIVGLVILIILLAMMFSLQNRLLQLQRTRGATTTPAR